MYIDCERCPAAGHACESCMMAALYGPPSTFPLDQAETAAVSLFAAAGLITDFEARDLVARAENLPLAAAG